MTQRSQGLTLLEENKQQTALSAGEYPSAVIATLNFAFHELCAPCLRPAPSASILPPAISVNVTRTWFFWTTARARNSRYRLKWLRLEAIRCRLSLPPVA